MAVLQDNLICLQQGLDLLKSLPTGAYAVRVPECFGSCIGGHIRHNVDHYNSFLQGCRDGYIDYDIRPRDRSVETDAEAGIKALKDILESLKGIERQELQKSVRVKMDTGSEDAGAWADSSVRRELQFLLSHTIHHYALVSVICRIKGIPHDGEFGVAPSTLRYRATLLPSC